MGERRDGGVGLESTPMALGDLQVDRDGHVPDGLQDNNAQPSGRVGYDGTVRFTMVSDRGALDEVWETEVHWEPRHGLIPAGPVGYSVGPRALGGTLDVLAVLPQANLVHWSVPYDKGVAGSVEAIAESGPPGFRWATLVQLGPQE